MKTKTADFLFRTIVAFCAGSLFVVTLLILFYMIKPSMPALQKFGFRFLFTSTWDPVKEVYGALPFIYGTVISSFLSLVLAVPLSLGTAIYLSELAPRELRQPLTFLVELLAAIPSVVYGLWGLFVLAPLLHDHVQPFLSRHAGFLPFFQGEYYGVGMMAAGIILSIMIIPTIASVSREVFLAVPFSQREAALALGATRWEATRLAVLKYARTGVIGAVILGLGRALGETMAVTMVIGNKPQISASLFDPSYTMSAVIANEFTEATSDLYVGALIEVGLVLFFVTLLLNILARLLVWSVSRSVKGRLME